MTAEDVLSGLRALVRPGRGEAMEKFLQAFPGGYGEGDACLGVVVPDQRKVAKQFRELELKELAQLMQSPWHEARLTALFILVDQFKRAKKSPIDQKRLVDLYLKNISYINNWDLVDSSSPHILGVYSLSTPEFQMKIDKLADSGNLWKERIAVLSTFAQLRVGQFENLIRYANQFLTHRHDLMHKAVGWMLREMGQIEKSQLIDFLEEHAGIMPRTMLRYSLEKLSPKEREKYMKRKFEV